MAKTFIKIASTTVGSGGAANITFTSIPSDYTDLVVYLSLRGESGGYENITVSLNGSTTTRDVRYLYGDGSAVGAGTSSTNFAGYWTPASNTASTFSSHFVYIPNYLEATNKSFLADSVDENNATGAYAWMDGNIWANTSAVTSIEFQGNGAADIAEHSTATLYGILKA